MTYKHILLCTDLSPNSEPATKRAADIAKQQHATLDIVHVVENSPLAYGGEFSVPIDIHLEQAIEAHVHKELTTLSRNLKITSNHVHILHGNAKQLILELADKLTADLIVVGSHGHHGISIILGSHANAILHHAKCDVLSVRANGD